MREKRKEKREKRQRDRDETLCQRLLLFTFYFLLSLPYTLYPAPLVYAAPSPTPLELAKEFPYGHIESLGEGLGYLKPLGFGIAGLAIVFSLLWGSFQYLSSGGDKAKIESAQAAITHSIIGFILLLFVFILFEILPQLFNLRGFHLISP